MNIGWAWHDVVAALRATLTSSVKVKENDRKKVPERLKENGIDDETNTTAFANLFLHLIAAFT